jgi:hypothetical protein
VAKTFLNLLIQLAIRKLVVVLVLQLNTRFRIVTGQVGEHGVEPFVFWVDVF